MTGAGERRTHGTALAGLLTVSALCAFIVTVIWGSTGAGYFWPMWVWLGLLIGPVLIVRLRDAWRHPRGPERQLAVHRELSLTSGGLQPVLWALSGGGFFWPVFPMLGLGSAYILHARFRSAAHAELAIRIDELTRTRRGALDVQAAELRRIERDLHDGAQARLVALSIQLGRAEERLAAEPEAAQLVRRAREEATAAIRELRDLARGIAPPILADRGLPAAVQALVQRSPVSATVTSDMTDRPAPVVETAAYFVIAEALTNAVKHAPGAPVRIALRQTPSQLQVDISDDGPGGADPNGSGLTGLRQRVEALDGRLTLSSPSGDGTQIVADLPCA